MPSLISAKLNEPPSNMNFYSLIPLVLALAGLSIAAPIVAPNIDQVLPNPAVEIHPLASTNY